MNKIWNISLDIHYILWYYHFAMIHVRFLLQREGRLLRRSGSDRVRIAHVYGGAVPTFREAFLGFVRTVNGITMPV